MFNEPDREKLFWRTRVLFKLVTCFKMSNNFYGSHNLWSISYGPNGCWSVIELPKSKNLCSASFLRFFDWHGFEGNNRFRLHQVSTVHMQTVDDQQEIDEFDRHLFSNHFSVRSKLPFYRTIVFPLHIRILMLAGNT